MNLIVNIEEQLHDYLLNQGLISHDTKWFPQTGGRTNKVWRLIGNHDLICKLYLNSSSNPLFANTPTAEYQCLSLLKGTGVAPDLYEFLETPFGQILLYYYIEGPIWEQGAESVANLLCRVHELKPPPKLRILSGLSNDIKNHGLDILKKLTSTHKDKLLGLCPNVTISDITPVLIHTDVVAGNLIFGPEGLRLIDWQCPALGDPVVDVAMFISPGMHMIYGTGNLKAFEREAFLRGLSLYLRARYDQVGLLYHWRLAAYCLWRADQGELGYEGAALAEIALLEEAQ
jgi:thiamine kinase-like enzyme